ncbi:MAG: beta-lactamase family protein [Ignavibacteriales bacterium]|nr:beta-lactamase family protein [Ignavibacteriales bacterium]MBI3788223.1 beta-lactamase family protein [Ignavibacteriales bacterium]
MSVLAFRCMLFVVVGCSLTIAQPIDRSALENLVSRADQTHSEAILVYKDGKIKAEQYFHNGSRDKKIEAMSATKSIIGLAITCMLTDGTLDSLDVPVCKFYPEWKQGQKQNITVRHLLTHTSGMQNVPNTGVEIYPSPDFVQLALAAELKDKPGTQFEYNNKALNLISGVIKKATNKRMDIYIGERLFKPLGISDFTWTLDSAGNPHAMAGCQLRPADLLKLGILILQNGSWEGTQVISPKWIREMVTPAKLYKGYGLLWWLLPRNVISVVSDTTIDSYHKFGLDKNFIAQCRQMVGTYKTDEEFERKLIQVFGNDVWDIFGKNLVAKGLQLRTRQFGEIIGYKADGYLGNYLVVYPSDNLAAVRMTSEDSYKDENDSFIDFSKLVLGLVKSNQGK